MKTYCKYCPRGYGDCVGFKDRPNNRIVLSIEEAEKDLLSAITDLYKYDYDLIERSVNERCITSHLFHYFLQENADKYANYNIDAEYNKNGDRKKVFNDAEDYCYPDFIIHRRYCNNENLLYVEYKKDSLSSGDLKKLKQTTMVNEERKSTDLQYLLGCGVCLCKRDIEFHWYHEGDEVCLNTYTYVFEEKCFKLKV